MIEINKYMIPRNLDLHEHTSKYPTDSIKNFSVDKLIRLLHLIFEKYAYDDKYIEEYDGYVNLNSVILKENGIRNYNQYFKYLNDTGVITINNSYRSGDYSKSYKINDEYMEEGIRYVEARVYTRRKTRTNRRELPQQFSYFHDHFKRLTVEADENNLDMDFNFYPLNNIIDGRYNLSYGLNGKRVFSVITNMNTELRKYIRLDGEYVYGADIRNSQPFLASILFEDWFWDADSSFNVYTVFPEITMDIKNYRYYLKQNNAAEDVKTYVNEVRTGTFYDHVGEEQRDKYKLEILFVMFDDDSMYADAKRKFQERYPNVYKLFRYIKDRSYNTLSVLLQRIESYLLLDVVCNRIHNERPEIPLITIHDSINTKKEYVGYVMDVIREEFRNNIGVEPTLKLDEWELAKSKNRKPRRRRRRNRNIKKTIKNV